MAVPVIATLLLLAMAPGADAVSNLGDTVAAWPASFRTYLMADGSLIADTNADQNPGDLDLASGPSGSSQTVYYATDGTTAFFRIRMATDLTDATKGGLVGGAFLVQLYQGTTLRAVVGIDGKSPSADAVYVSDAPGGTVTNVYTYPWTGTSAAVRTVGTGDGTGQHFLDFQVPVARIFTASNGTLTAATPLRLFYGSSAAANLATINKDFMLGDATTYLSFLPSLSEISLVPGALATTRTTALVSGTDPPTGGAISTYDISLTMTDTGDGLLNSATTTATIPSGVSYVSSTVPAGNGTVSISGTTLTWNAGTIYGQTSKSIVVRVSTTPPNSSAGAQITLLSAISSSALDASVPTTRTASAPDVTVGPVALGVNQTPVANDFSVTMAEDAGPTAIDATTSTTDADGGVLTYTVTGGVAHGTLTGTGAGAFTYTPAADYNGPDSFTYTVCDASAACDTATVTIGVTPVNDAPVAAGTAVTTTEDTASTVNLNGLTSDVDGGPLTYTASQPTNGTVSVNAGVATYTPAADYNGPDSFTYTVCDTSEACDTATVTITVTAVDDAPVASAGADQSPGTGATVNLDGTASSDPDGDVLTYTWTQTGGPTVSLSGASTATPSFVTPTGPVTLTFRLDVNDGTTTTSDSVNIVVSAAPNSAPVANDFSVTMPEDAGPTGIDATANTSDADGGVLTYTVTGGAAHGTLTGDGAGGFTYTPNADYNGPDSFTYTVCDTSEACDTATVTITVTAVNDAPVAAGTAVTATEDTPSTIDLNGLTSDVDGGPLTHTASQPTNGTVSIVGGIVTYTPNADYNGPDSFTYTVCDTSTACTTATITITVTAVNDRPTAQPASASTGEKAPVDVQLSGQDRDGDGLTYAIVTPPGGGTVSVVAATGLATYTPAPGHGGVDTFTYTVSDGTTTSASATVTVTTVLGSDGTYFPVSPHRLLDTRVATGTSSRTRVGSGQTIAVQVAGVAGSGLPATGIAAVSINLTATEATGNGYLVAHASGTPRPPSSNVNYVTAASVPNAAIVPVGADGKVLIFNTGSSVHLVVDVVGWYSGPGRAPGSRLQVLPPARLLDTRTPGLGPIGSNSTLDVQVTGVPGTGVPATGVAAVVMNLTQAGNDQGGWMTVYPTGEARQYTSSLNFAPGDIDPNMVVSKVGTGGKVSIYNLQGNAHVIIDILGYYTDPGGSGGRFVSIAAERLADTRSPVGGGAATPIGAGQTIAVGVAGVPGSAIPSIGQDGTTGVVANITVASTTIGGYLTVYPSGDARQGTSTLNMTPNQVVPNMTITKVGEGGRISIYNDLGQTNVIVDVVGYFRF